MAERRVSQAMSVRLEVTSIVYDLVIFQVILLIHNASSIYYLRHESLEWSMTSLCDN